MTSDKTRIERMYLEILAGTSKENSMLNPLSDEESSQWDRLEEQIREIKESGGGFIIPNEIP